MRPGCTLEPTAFGLFQGHKTAASCTQPTPHPPACLPALPACLPAVHQLEGLSGGIAALTDFLQEKGFLLNEEGGLIKVRRLGSDTRQRAACRNLPKGAVPVYLLHSFPCVHQGTARQPLPSPSLQSPWPLAPSRAQVSPDGGLLQSSTVAVRISYCFAGGETQLVPGSYVEWAERQVLPEFASLPAEEVREWHRRDGFEQQQ